MQIHDGLIFTNQTELEKFYQSKPGEFHAVCRFESREEIDQLFDWIYEVRDIALHVDEFNLFWTGRKDEPLARIVDFARNHGITLVSTAKRPTQVPRLLTASATYIVTFQTTDENDLDFFKGQGFNIDAVRALPDHEYLSVEV